ncbi:hypothetical protein KCU85_g2212, partial [Aureobasidium melanogenum]
MSFNDLDAVILMLIADQLYKDEPRIAQYATISRPWLSVVETLTFRQLRVDSHDRLHQTSQYLTPDRRLALRRLDVTIHLPEYGEAKWNKLETEAEKATNDEAFSTSLTRLFETISSWSTLAASDLPESKPLSFARGAQSRFALEVQAICKSDFYHLNSKDQYRRRCNSKEDREMARHESSYLKLTQELPRLPEVSELIIHGGAPRVPRELHPRYISAKAALRILEACPSVDRIELQLSDMESKNLTQRNSEREACARALGSVPSTVTHMQLHYPGVIPQNQFFDPPIVPTFNGKDFFSCSINTLSQQLESLHLFAVVSDDLFDITSPTIHWPKLRNLHVDFDVVMPNGTWMIEQDPEDSEPEIDPDEDMEYNDLRTYDDWSDHEMLARFDWPTRCFRIAPNRDAFDGVYLAIAQALPRMPNLRSMRLSVDQGTAGCLCTYASDGRGNHKVLWRTCSTTIYEPHPEVIAEWENAFAQRSGKLEIQVASIDDPTATDLVTGVTWPHF